MPAGNEFCQQLQDVQAAYFVHVYQIEQAVIDAMYIGFNDREREFTTEDILTALQHQVPLSVSQREQIEKLRSWLREGRAQSASFSDAADAESQFVPIQIELGSGKD